jgi:hypothetical protein
MLLRPHKTFRFINLTAPIVGIPFGTFVLATFIGILSLSFWPHLSHIFGLHWSAAARAVSSRAHRSDACHRYYGSSWPHAAISPVHSRRRRLAHTGFPLRAWFVFFFCSLVALTLAPRAGVLPLIPTLKPVQALWNRS